MPAPSVGWARSYHLRFEVPTGLVATDAAILKLGAASTKPADPPRDPSTYLSKVGATDGHLYTGGVDRANYVAYLQLSTPVAGFLRSAWLSTVFTAVVLGVAATRSQFIVSLQGSAGAIAALLLVVPSTLSAYLIRPGEHEILSSTLRGLRYLLTFTCGLAYLTAAMFLLRVEEPGWYQATAIASIVIAAMMTMIVRNAKVRTSAMLSRMDHTEQHTIDVVEFDE